MAGDWIKFEHTTPDKPEVFQLAQILGIDPDAVVGKLCRIWIWADQHTVDGDAPSVTSALLDRHAGVTGFTDAMVSVGWMVKDGDRIRFPNFGDHNGQTAKKRALGRARQDRYRNVSRESDAPSVTKASPEKRREEKRRTTTTAASPPGGGGGGDSDSPEPKPADQTGETFAILTDGGVSKATAKRLRSTPPERAREVVKAADRVKGVRDRSAWVAKAIGEEWDVEDPAEVKRTQAALRDARREAFELERARKRRESLHGVGHQNGAAK